MSETMHEISVQELEAEGFRRDSVGEKAFHRPYAWINYPCLLLLLGAYLLARYVIGPQFPHRDWSVFIFAIAAPAFLVLGGTYLHIRRKIPISRANGQPLIRYTRTDVDPHKVSLEYVYVDRTSKTYFTYLMAGSRH